MKLTDRRDFYRKGLSTLYLPLYDGLCSLLGPMWQPYTGVRTFQEQDGLFAAGRAGDGRKIVTWARGGESAHNYGCASDWTLWDEAREQPIWLDWKDLRWAPYHQAIKTVGLKWGNDWNRNGLMADEHTHDAYHNELPLTCSWRHVLVAYNLGGMTTAQEHIEANLAK